jgi:hypothetical protein
MDVIREFSAHLYGLDIYIIIMLVKTFLLLLLSVELFG